MNVWNFVIPLADTALVDMPIHAEILFVANQREELCLWARVNPDNPTETRRFRVRGTGHDNATGSYIGSALFRDGTLVFHVFEDHSED